MKRIVGLASISLEIVLLVGCSTPRPRVDAHIPQNSVMASRMEILSSIVPSFPVQQQKDVIADQGRNSLVGTWTASYVSESKNGNLTRGYLYKGKTTSTYHRVDKYFDDGTYRVVLTYSGKETVMTGKWVYDNGVFTAITTNAEGKETRFSFVIRWHDKDEFESRIADLPGYEKILMRGGTMKSAKCRYDDNGLFHTEMIIGTADLESAVVLVQSPIVYERDKSNEEQP